MVTIRPETATDHPDVWRINELAFGSAGEAALVAALRTAADPYVSLVAVEGSHLVGHIFFSPVSIETPATVHLAFGLAPMAVLPDYQRRGVGSLLVTEGLKECQRLGGDLVVVIGHHQYYPRFGFRPAGELGLRCEYEVPPEAFLVLELRPGALTGVRGLVRYHQSFGDV